MCSESDHERSAVVTRWCGEAFKKAAELGLTPLEVVGACAGIITGEIKATTDTTLRLALTNLCAKHFHEDVTKRLRVLEGALTDICALASRDADALRKNELPWELTFATNVLFGKDPQSS